MKLGSDDLLFRMDSIIICDAYPYGLRARCGRIGRVARLDIHITYEQIFEWTKNDLAKKVYCANR
jgi:hypothetical protein